MIFTLKNEISEISKLAEAVRDFGNCNNLPDKVIFEANLSLEELITNIIFYGYDSPEEHEIDVNLCLTDGDLILKIEDDAKPFNPLEVQDPDVSVPLDEREVGGLGIFLVRKMMDDIEYQRTENKNQVVLRKKLVD
jgi:anti-sigma regulatory factor (Ser/Thr protein kinase)